MPNDYADPHAPPPPYRRATDPPEGSWAARLNDLLTPWSGLIITLGVVAGAVWTILMTLGFSLHTPEQQVAALRLEIKGQMDTVKLRITRLEEADRESKLQRDRTEQWAMALVRSKCLELRGNDEAAALTVLPCGDLFREWTPPRPRARQSVPPLATPPTAPAPATLTPQPPADATADADSLTTLLTAGPILSPPFPLPFPTSRPFTRSHK